ncbi:MAG: hypothetical protein AAFX50_14460, partial [Acidobacteriota bacterium]
SLPLWILSLALLGAACQAPPPSTGDEELSDTPAPSGAEPTEAVQYVPAYPTDVSTEELDADDAAQQQTHSHGADEHTHGDAEHDRDDPNHGGHVHGDSGHDDHDHGDGNGR